MVELWRLGRNRYGRAVYEGLTAAGVTATWMSEYRRDLAGATAPSDPTGLSVTACDPDRVAPLGAPVDELVAGESVVAAFDGAYLRRVYVDPDERQRGVASALVETACGLAREVGAGRATALVARDNVPSRALFESHDFDVVRDRRYVRVGPLTHRSVRTRPVSN